MADIAKSGLGDNTCMAPDPHVALSPAKIAGWLLLADVALTVLNLVVQVAHIWGHDTLFGFGPLFAYTDPRALVHLWIALLLFACAGIVGLLTYLRDQRGLASSYWAGLIVLFVFLGIDEGVALHDVLTLPVRAAFSHVDLLHTGWVLPYGLLLAVVGVAYLPFLWTLTLRTATWLTLAALLYFAGMIVCTALAGRELLYHGDQWSFAYAAFVTLAEAFKQAGIAALVYGLLDYIAREFPELRLGLATRRPRAHGSAVSSRSTSSDAPRPRPSGESRIGTEPVTRPDQR